MGKAAGTFFQGAVDADTIVLGHYPEYLQLGESIAEAEWAAMSLEQQWAVNQAFLDQAIARGGVIRLATLASDAIPGSFYERELQYMISRIYSKRGRYEPFATWEVIFMELPTLPLPMQHLRSELESSGFLIIESRYDAKNFGDMLLVLRKGGLCIGFLRDRREWFVRIGGPDCADWFSPIVWRDYLSRGVANTEFPTIEEQCQIVSDALEAIESAVTHDVDLLRRLQYYREERWKARRSEWTSIQPDVAPT